MAYYTFTFENTNDGQTFTVLDKLDSSKNPIFRGPVNHNQTSPSIRCWVGDHEKGRVSIEGEYGPLVEYDVRDDGEVLRY